ncbi:MAG TPA: protein-glutamate O-methyltransferase CheR [Spirochaetota bacterium]|nr:protein-glutamate O-methyltransferase CheR [Spirochaetota bacterium]
MTAELVDNPNYLLKLKDGEFRKIAALIKERFGINLTASKKALVAGRLNKLIKNLGFKNFTQYLDYLENSRDSKDLLALIDKISTNHSYFYREKEHFIYLRDTLLPEITAQFSGEEIRIWCAGCAGGEEAYTLAMVIDDFFNSTGINKEFKILATDISVQALAAAVKGVYPAGRVKSLSPSYKNRYFHKDDNMYIIKKDLKRHILFKRLNFINRTFPFKNRFHLIFCRNVMIYFDQPTRTELVSKFYRQLMVNGYFFIGHSETVDRNTCPFRYIKPTIYKKDK